jgi:hypothetical protein
MGADGDVPSEIRGLGRNGAGVLGLCGVAMTEDDRLILARLWASLWDAERAALVAWFGVDARAAGRGLDGLAAKWAAELGGYAPVGRIGPKLGRTPLEKQ